MLCRLQCRLPKLNDYILLMHNQHWSGKLHGAGAQVSEEGKVIWERLQLCSVCHPNLPFLSVCDFYMHPGHEL